MSDRIAIFCPVHSNPKLVAEQIDNYNHFFNEKVAHILHPAIGGKITKENSSDYFKDRENVIFCENQKMTSWRTIFGAYIAITEFINKSFKNDFDYVYIHTDSDLLIKGDIYSWIIEKKLGYSGSLPSRKWKWPYILQTFEEPEFCSLRKALDIPEEDLLVGRQEGAFFPIDIWNEAIRYISQYYHNAYFNDTDRHWPIEESVLPTVVKKLTDSIPHESIIIRTKELPQRSENQYRRDKDANCIQIEDIKAWLEKDSLPCLGLKWFSQNLSHPARKYLKTILQSEN